MLVTRSEPVITLDVREKLAKSYAVYQDYRPYPRHGRLSEAPAVIETSGAGCVASTRDRLPRGCVVCGGPSSRPTPLPVLAIHVSRAAASPPGTSP